MHSAFCCYPDIVIYVCVCRYWGVVYSLKYAVLRAVSWFTLVNSLDKFKVHNEQLDVKQSSNWRLNKYRRWRSLHEWKLDMHNYNHHTYMIYKLCSLQSMQWHNYIWSNYWMLKGFLLYSHYRILCQKAILITKCIVLLWLLIESK